MRSPNPPHRLQHLHGVLPELNVNPLLTDDAACVDHHPADEAAHRPVLTGEIVGLRTAVAWIEEDRNGDPSLGQHLPRVFRRVRIDDVDVGDVLQGRDLRCQLDELGDAGPSV